MTASEFVERLDGVKKTANGLEARCPAHEDKKASLCVGTGSDGRVVIKCQAGCDSARVVEAMGLKWADLFPEGSREKSTIGRQNVVATYDYRDEKGEILFQVLRTSDKRFWQQHPDKTSATGWTPGLKGVRRVIYRLPEVLRAIVRGLPILIAEGEKDVNALAARGFCATCNPMGAGKSKWLPEYSESLRGADVVIVPDNDQPGREHAENIAAALKGIAKTVRTITLPIGKDSYDFFAGGGTSDQLIALIDRAKPARTFAEQVEDRRWNPSLSPPAIRPVYMVGTTPIATPGNLQTISAQAKTGKSAFVNAMLAAPMALDGSDTFGIVSSNPEGKAVILCDTEQSLEDFWHQVHRAIRRAGLDQPPPWLVPYCFTGFDAKNARAALILATEKAAQQFGGIHSIHLDGVADLVCDVNDAEECNAFVAELHAFAIQHDCPISGVIHFNPGSEKTRGHLGSQLERKAETNLRLDKDGEVTEVWSEKQRRAPILKGTGPRFKWSNDAGMHISCESEQSSRLIARRQEATLLRDDVFSSRPSMRYSDLLKEVQNAVNLSPSTAKRRVGEWVQLGIVEKSFGGLWVPKD